MVDDQLTHEEPGGGRRHERGDAPPDQPAARGALDSLAGLWQVPTILISMGLIALAVYVAIQRSPDDDFGAALAQTEQWIERGQLDTAALRLRDVLEPNLEMASFAERARFHAAVADWLTAAQRAEGVEVPANNRRIDEQYGLAVDLGLEMHPRQIEAWAYALISLGRIDDARMRLKELDAMDIGDGRDGDVRARRTRVFRRLVEASLNRDDVPRESLMRMLADHRADERTGLDDVVWAIARQAELRLDAGQPEQAVDQLLVDLRRLEYEVDRRQPINFAELYTLLGRGYFQIGRDREAEFHLERALEQFKGSEAMRGEALVLLGMIAAERGEHEAALERFDFVVREFVHTRSHEPALLGRAEARSILGEHGESRDDYHALILLLTQEPRPPRRDVTPQRVAGSLIDRHDAAVAVGNLDRALSYILLAERLFPEARMPVDVLLRIANTSYQRAGDLLAAVGPDAADLSAQGGRDDAAVRYEANSHYQRAAEAFVRHARRLAALPGEDEKWAESLFNAADSFDLAGLHERAITHFQEYLAGRSEQDPRRAEATARLAQCHHALMEYEMAAGYYETVIRDHPRSAIATGSHVPLARCYIALGRLPEAERQLRGMIGGMQPVQPDAADYRDALIELAMLYYNTGRFPSAIEHLHEAAERYAEDHRAGEVLFGLGDSHRRLARQLAERAADTAGQSPGERRRLQQERREHLRAAMEIFNRAVRVLERREGRGFSAMHRDLLRSAAMYRADCAFDLGLYEEAIHWYDNAARRWAEHHSSMHALIQIVNAYIAMGDEERAATAHRRALVRLRQLPERAFDESGALMDRAAWERWLENAPVGPLHAASAVGG